MNTDKVYILQKDLPDAKAGTRYTLNGDRYYPPESELPVIEQNAYFTWQVENNQEWFKQEENKSNDNFQWSSDKLLEEFAIDVANKWHGDVNLNSIINDFRKKHTPKPQEDYGVKDTDVDKYFYEKKADNKPEWEIVQTGDWRNPKELEITKVKRLIDGEVFSVGDEVGSKHFSKLKIHSFNIDNGTMMVKFVHDYCDLCWLSK